ncbi:MAG: AEC family transporter [Psychromonas sp.]
MELVVIVMPIFLSIFMGKIIHLYLVKSDQAWQEINKIAYWLLFPCFLFSKISTLDLNISNLSSYTGALLVGFFGALLSAYLLSKISSINTAALTSVLQGAGRHNTFIGLAISVQLFGSIGASIGIIATATLVPISNLVLVTLMVILVKKNSKNNQIAIIIEIFRNPIIVAILLGFLVNFLGLSGDPIFYELTHILGLASLPIILLCVGANIKISGLSQHSKPVLISVFTKMIVFPLLTFWICLLFELSQQMTIIAVIFAACPTSPSSFPLAKQLGGDASLMSTIISLQTLLSVLSIPLTVIIATHFYH